jgi:hypothetical protein
LYGHTSWHASQPKTRAPKGARSARGIAPLVQAVGFYAFVETLARRLAPGKTAASGELCLLGKDGHLLPTGSLLRLT